MKNMHITILTRRTLKMLIMGSCIKTAFPSNPGSHERSKRKQKNQTKDETKKVLPTDNITICTNTRN